MIPLILFITFMVIFGLVDLWFWIKGKETMSEWIVDKAANSKLWAWVILGIIVGTAITLVIHFELLKFLP